MHTTIAVGTAQQLTHTLTLNLSSSLSRTPLLLYQALHTVAVEVARVRGYYPKTSQVSFHIPAEIVATALSIHRSTLYEHLPQLKALGLVDARAHRTTHRGRTVADGTVWSVKLNPQRGKSARVSYQDLKHKWRDLGADIERGRTAWRQIRQSSTQKGKPVNYQLLLDWALPHQDSKTPLSMTVGFGLEGVLDVPYAARSERGQMVDGAARAMAHHLGDESVNFYRWLLWQLLRVHDRGQDYFGSVYQMLLRAGVDHQEGFARSAGALFVSRLKQWEVWEQLKSTPPYAVGPKP